MAQFRFQRRYSIIFLEMARYIGMIKKIEEGKNPRNKPKDFAKVYDVMCCVLHLPPKPSLACSQPVLNFGANLNIVLIKQKRVRPSKKA